MLKAVKKSAKRMTGMFGHLLECPTVDLEEEAVLEDAVWVSIQHMQRFLSAQIWNGSQKQRLNIYLAI